MATRWARFVRGWVTALLSVFVAAFSHVVGGGSIPGQLGVTLAIVAAGLVSIALAGKSLSRVRLGISVALSQFAFHSLFSLGTGTPPMLITPTGSAHQHGAMVMDVASAASGSSLSIVDNSSMWIAHAAAALITIVLLRQGEAAFWGLVNLAKTTWIAVLLPRHVFIVSAHIDAMRVRFAVADSFGLRDLGVILSGRPYRGPPRRLVLPS